MDSDSYIIRIYRSSELAPKDGQLAGVIENLNGETRSFHNVTELWAILGQCRKPFTIRAVDDPDRPPRKSRK